MSLSFVIKVLQCELCRELPKYFLSVIHSDLLSASCLISRSFDLLQTNERGERESERLPPGV